MNDYSSNDVIIRWGKPSGGNGSASSADPAPATVPTAARDVLPDATVLVADADFAARVTFIARAAKANGYEDVAAWMMRHLSDDRSKRKACGRFERGRTAKLRQLRRILDQ